MGRMAEGPHEHGSEGVPVAEIPPGYALVQLSTQSYKRAVHAAMRDAALMAALIFLGAGSAAFTLWAAARRRDREIPRLRREVAEARHLASVGRLAGSVAHEVRNPLSALRGLVQLLAKDQTPPPRREEYARVAVEEIDRLERVVSGLLDYTRPREPRPTALDLSETLRAALEFMAEDPRARGVDMDMEVAPSLPPVLADPDQVRQVLVNLVVNALEALNGEGRLRLRARQDGDRVVVEVADSGPGLPGVDPEELFDPFFSARERGAGLGLAIARRLVQAQGGELSAGSAPEGGALFTFTLPLAPGSERA
jgi:two-component system sensor histidine kinase HydH